MSALGHRIVRFWRENWFFVLIVGSIVGGFLALRTPASGVRSVAEVDAILQSGRPTLVEFYSNT